MKNRIELTLSKEKLLETIVKVYFGEDYTKDLLKNSKIDFVKNKNSSRVDEVKISIN